MGRWAVSVRAHDQVGAVREEVLVRMAVLVLEKLDVLVVLDDDHGLELLLLLIRGRAGEVDLARGRHRHHQGQLAPHVHAAGVQKVEVVRLERAAVVELEHNLRVWVVARRVIEQQCQLLA